MATNIKILYEDIEEILETNERLINDINKLNYGIKNHKIIEELKINPNEIGIDNFLTLSNEDKKLRKQQGELMYKLIKIKEQNIKDEKTHKELLNRLVKSEDDKNDYVKKYVKNKKPGKLSKDIERLLSKFV